MRQEPLHIRAIGKQSIVQQLITHLEHIYTQSNVDYHHRSAHSSQQTRTYITITNPQGKETDVRNSKEMALRI